MDNHTTNSGDEAVTITEALKHLAKLNLTPARQSFYDAVNTGKILEVTDKENNPDGKRMVSWPSVFSYVEGGGFKPRQKSSVTTVGESETAATETAPEVPDSTAVAAVLETGNPKPPNPNSPPIIPGTKGDNHSAGNDSAKHRPKPHSKGKRKPAPSPESTNPEGEDKSPENNKSKGRRNPPLRAIKNGLRHLGFEDTKAIRDWADNRLLTVLRPTHPLTESSPIPSDIKQPA
jgi:hypothetical protein